MKALPACFRLRSLRKPKNRRFTALLACFGVLALIMLTARAPLSRAQTTESISTFATDCVTPKTFFNLGDRVCAVATNTPLGPPVQRRFEWVTPDGNIFQLGPDINSDPDSNSITIPSSGPLAQVGPWTVKTVDVSNNGYAVARFVVQDPNNAAVDLWVPMFGPSQVSAGSSAPFTVYVTNKGPNDAQNVQLSVTVATNSTFSSETQLSGPAFTCTSPAVGSTGSSTCTLATLPANTTAVLQFIFQVDVTAPPDSTVTCTATVSSATAELFDVDNTSTVSANITSQTCEITCPPDITTTKTAGQCGAVVDYGTPSGSGSNCGTIVCSPPSGTFFPTGTTNVICFGDSGNACAFTVTVRDPQPPTIHCPGNVSVAESSPGMGSAVVNYPPPTLNDNCPAPLDACQPPAGSSFSVGTTTVTCTTDDGAGNTATCSFTVTVTSLVCTLHCPTDIVANENPTGSGSATVTYSQPTTTGCSSLTITCNPVSGSSFPVGSTTVECTGNDAGTPVATCSFTVTVVVNTPCTITCSANIIVANEPDQCGAVVDYASPTTTGNCGDAPTCSPATGSFFPIGTTVITCTTEAGPHCSFTVKVNDVQPPILTCPGNIGPVPNAAGQCAAIVSFSPTVSDNCPGASAVCSPPSGSPFQVGVTAVSCTATDASGNTAACGFTVTVVDAQPPTITTCAADRILSTNGGSQVALPDLTGGVVASDNCTPAGSLVITQSPAAGTMLGLGATAVTLTVKDAANNQATCTVTVTVYRYLVKDFVAFSSESTKLATNVSVNTGNVGANQSLPDPNGPPDDQVEVELGVNAKMLQTGSSVVGDTVKLGVNSQVYNVYFNESQFSNQAHILGNQVTPQPLPVSPMPAFPTITPGTTDVSVGINQTQTLGPGSYRNITVQTNGTLTLSGGTYQITSLSLGANAKVLFQTASEVRVKNGMTGNANNVIGPHSSVPTLQASQIVFYVEGADSPSAVVVDIGTNTTVKANIYAPNGTVWLRTGTNATGAFIGKRMLADTNAQLTLKSAF